MIRSLLHASVGVGETVDVTDEEKLRHVVVPAEEMLRGVLVLLEEMLRGGLVLPE